MKTLLKYLGLKRILNKNNLTNCSQSEVLMMNNRNKGSKSNIISKNRLALTLKEIYILFGVSPNDANAGKLNDPYCSVYNIPNKKK